MKYKAKLIATLMTMCLVLSFAVIGILAVKTLNMSVGGNISFTADGVSFTVGNGVFYESNKTTEYTGITSQSGKLQGFAMNTNTKLADVQDEIATWAGLELNLDSRGDSVLKFNIKNDMSDKHIYVTFAVTLGTNTNNNMNIVAPTSEEIYPTENKNIEITFDILDMNINAGLKGFKIDITISDTAGNPGSTESNPIDSTELPNLTFDTATASNGCISVKNNGATGDVVIPAYVKVGTITYAVTEIESNGFLGATGITSIILPSTLKKINSSAFSNTRITSITIPESVTEIGASAFSLSSVETVIILSKDILLGGLCFDLTSAKNVYLHFDPGQRNLETYHALFNNTAVVYIQEDVIVTDGRFTQVSTPVVEGYKTYTETIYHSHSGGAN